MNAPQPIETIRPDNFNVESETKSQLNLWEYWRLFRRHWISVAIIGLAGFLIAGWYGDSLTPMYSASVAVVIDPNRGKPPGAAEVSYYYTQQLYFNTQQTILNSRVIAERTARKLTQTEKDLLVARKAPGMFAQAVADFKKELTELLSPAAKPAPKGTATKITPDAEAEGVLTYWGGRIRGGRRISPSGDSQIMTISFVSPNPQIAALVANKMADAYIEYIAESAETLSAQTGKWMAQQVERLRDNLTESQNALQKFRIQEGLVDLKNVQELASNRLQSVNQELATAQKSVEELSKRYGPKHPKLIRARSQLASAKQNLSKESHSILLNTDQELQLAKLENDANSSSEIYELFLSRFRKMDFASSSSVSPIYMLDRAQVPGGPFSPNKKRIATTGLFGGLFLGLLLAWLREKLDNTFHNPAQLESEFGISVLGAVPLLGKDERRFDHKMQRKSRIRDVGQFERFYFHNSKSPFAEAINHIRTGVLYSSAEQSPKSVLITSAIQSEGKTTFATNLALAFSQLGETILIDADLRKPRVHQMAGVKHSSGGLVELLIGRATLEDVLITDEGSHSLKILKSGTIPPNPQEILSSKRLDDLLVEFEDRFDHIVIDCAPVLPVSDALVLSSKVDALILLAEANATSRDLVADALKKVRSVNAPLIGAVLSLFNRKRTSYYGRYAYYSKYYSYAYGKK